MKKNILITVFANVLLCSMLVACGDSKATDSSTSTKQTEPTEVTTTSDATPVAETPEVPTKTVADYTGKTTLSYIGHASVKIVAKDGTVIYIDPNYANGDYSDEADYILVTHSHSDHQPCAAVTLKETGEKITYREALHDGTYESYDFGNVQIEAVPAGGNTNHNVNNCVGYLITVDGVTIYHAGDTSTLESMSDLAERDIDYAMYPIDGVYNMDAVEATEVANLVCAKTNIPIHEFDDHEKDDTVKRKSDDFTPEGRLVLEYGETIVIGE